ncbi:MAG: NAD(P)/FAD-dependent oxidoreductase [Xanthobacteraceae bacterium]
METIVIAGAGQAGGRAAEALRAAGFAGTITMIGAEPHAPYERPQLSKQFLSAPAAEVAYLKPAGHWQSDLAVELVTGAELTAGDPARRLVADRSGREFRYDRLLMATGTVARELPVLAAAGQKVHTLRSIEDAARLRPHLHARSRVVIVGGGVIGLEAAAAAAKLGCEVTVIESAAHLLARAFPKLISDVVEARHRAAGVCFRFGVTVAATTATGVRLSDGTELAADAILVGVGVDPAAGLAPALGLTVDGGIAVDACGATAIEAIYCAGDIALQWSPWHGRRMRVETWANAQNQAISTARNMVGAGRAYTDPPWFWTDQYELNIQVVGDLGDAEHVVRGSVEAGRFSVAGLRDGELVGAVAVNAAKDMASFRRLVAAHAKIAPADLASSAYDLRRAS